MKKNILIFMSDQHTPLMSEFAGGPAETPNLNSLCDKGLCFDSAYTTCPLCAPARMSFMTGKLSSKLEILNNFAVLPDTIPTIAHAFAAGGYETVLIGRMHFVGDEQKHGFQKRFVGDVSSPEWKPTPSLVKKLAGDMNDCFSEPACTRVVGAGSSPVLEFDDDVVNTALKYLSEKHDKPQFIVVGTYGPHFPYIAPKERYEHYKKTSALPESFYNPPEFLDPATKIRLELFHHDEDSARRARAAYCAMIEKTDKLVGKVFDAFKKYCDSDCAKSLFVYTSDHGDMCGEKGLFAKMSFFEEASRIPMIMVGDEIPTGMRRNDPVSIIDLLPTVCGEAGVEAPPFIDGKNILDKEYDKTSRSVFSEMYGIFGAPGKWMKYKDYFSITRMVRKGKYKFITRKGFEKYDMLFDLESDPKEEINRIDDYPEIAEGLSAELSFLPDSDTVDEFMNKNWAYYDFMQKAQPTSENMQKYFWTKTSAQGLAEPSV